MVERRSLKLVVAGSSPVIPSMRKQILILITVIVIAKMKIDSKFSNIHQR